MNDNLGRFHAAIADLSYKESLRVRQHLLGFVSDHVSPDVWDRAIESALATEVDR